MTSNAHARLDLLLSLRRFREAETLARECLASEPNCANWHAQLVRALFGQKRNEEALEVARTAAGLAPENPWVLAILAWLLTQMDRPSEALEVLHDVLRVDPRYAWGYELLAVANTQLGRKDESTMAARKAVELAPEDESAWIQLGWAQFGQQQYHEAIAAAETGLRLHPESAAMHNLLGHSLTHQADLTRWSRRFRIFRKAHDHLREALRLEPGEPAHAINLLFNTVAWRRAAYRMGLAIGLVVLTMGGYAIGYLFIGHVALVFVALMVLLVFFLREALFEPPDYGLAILPLGWIGLPDVPMAPEDRSQGRGDWLRWIGAIVLGLALLGGYMAFKAGIYSLSH